MNPFTITTLCICLIFHSFAFGHATTTFVETTPTSPTTEDGKFVTSGVSEASDATEGTTEKTTASNTDETSSSINHDTSYTTEDDIQSSSTNPQTYTTTFQKPTIPSPKDKCANGSAIVRECNVDVAVMGVPIIDKFYVNAFTPACTRHDICYKCGARFHKSRENCDVNFLDTMTDICKNMDGVYDQAACGGIAGVFYAHVYLSGQIQYNEQPNSDCSNIWVAICLG